MWIRQTQASYILIPKKLHGMLLNESYSNKNNYELLKLKVSILKTGLK